MKNILILIICASFFLGACQNASVRKPVEEGQWDARMTESRPAATLPETDPGEPQPEFDQEIIQAQNP